MTLTVPLGSQTDGGMAHLVNPFRKETIALAWRMAKLWLLRELEEEEP